MKKKKKDTYDNDYDRWGTTPGTTFSLDDIDEIEEVDKSIEHIEEVQKFNPFHDSAGKFSSSQGMKSYSANPKTKAGQMAIQRSTAAGYGAVFNVHRESKGENIRQNDMWIKGQGKPTPSQLARAQANAPKTVAQMRQNAHTNRVKGTMGATETATARHPQKPKTQQQNQQNQNQQNQQTPAQTQQQNQQTQSQGLKADTANIHLTQSHNIAIKPRDRFGDDVTTHNVAKDHYQQHVQGKDLSSSVDVTKIIGGGNAIDKIARAQGWDKASTVTNDIDVFRKAAVQSGQMMIRTVHPDGSMSSDDVLKNLITNGKSNLNGKGAQAYGPGIYFVGAKIGGTDAKGRILTGRNQGRVVADSQQHSAGYGDTQVMATIHPKAKIADPNTAYNLSLEFSNLSPSERGRFGYDEGVYIASKGYDGAQWHSDDLPYITMYNKSAMIYYGEAASV